MEEQIDSNKGVHLFKKQREVIWCIDLAARLSAHLPEHYSVAVEMENDDGVNVWMIHIHFSPPEVGGRYELRVLDFYAGRDEADIVEAVTQEIDKFKSLMTQYGKERKI